MIQSVHISSLFGAKGATICLKSEKICPQLAHFSHRFFKADRLLACIFHGDAFDEVKRGFRGARAVPAEPENHAGLLAVNGRVIFCLPPVG